jgi:WD40 repeat protein
MAMYIENDTPPGLKLRCTLHGSRSALTKIAWSLDGQTIACGSIDHNVYLWNAWTGEPRYTLKGHTRVVSSATWSPDGQTLASGSDDGTVMLWNVQTGTLFRTLKGHRRNVTSVAWSSDGRTLASGSDDGTIRVWNAKNGKLLRILTEHADRVLCLVWSPDGQTLASASFDMTIRLWDSNEGKLLKVLAGHTDHILSVAWSPDGQTLASASTDRTIRLWKANIGQQTTVLEEHTDSVLSVSFSADGRFVASKSLDNTIRLWYCETWETITMPSQWGVWPYSGLAFHPKAPVLATLGDGDRVIHIWELDINTLQRRVSGIHSVQYRNTKVVLVGDSGVGKSALGLVLSGQSFRATDSTHGRYVWTFDDQEVDLGNGRKETREILLWDLAGQPGYRLIHQLHLNEVAVALILFDARSETDPFAGVRYWDRALRQAWRLQGDSAPPMKKFLISARADRGRISASKERIEFFMHELGFDGYYETSAKEGWGIEILAMAIREAVIWEAFPRVSASELFQNIKAFLLAQKKTGRLLSIADDLYQGFLKSKNAPTETEELRAHFDTCLGLVGSRGLILHLNFGNLVLLQPEMLDTYASALVNAARDQPDGMGSILEDDAREGRFRMPEGERIQDKEQEKLLLIATIENLLRREIILRERGDNGMYLVFPSQFTREHSALTDPGGEVVTFGFEGPPLNVYTTLAVRLSQSGQFRTKEMWKNAVAYTANLGGTCGMILRELEEGHGELTLFFDTLASEETCFHFEEFVHAHLQRRALPESIFRRRLFICPGCGTPVTDLQVARRRERGFNWIECNVCENHVSLLDGEERLSMIRPSLAPEMDRVADVQRDREAAKSILQGKISLGDFDVFLCHNDQNKPLVKKIGEQLKEQGIYPWLDEWELQLGRPWESLLEEQKTQIRSAAVFVGREGAPWHQEKLDAILREFVARGCQVITVLLRDVTQKPEPPEFLEGRPWVDFREHDLDPLGHLIGYIIGKQYLTQGFIR